MSGAVGPQDIIESCATIWFPLNVVRLIPTLYLYVIIVSRDRPVWRVSPILPVPPDKMDNSLFSIFKVGLRLLLI